MQRNYCGTPRETIPLRILDFFVNLYTKLFYTKSREVSSKSPRILIASLGHLGDALTTSYLFPIIKKKYPDAKIDVVIPEWCKLILAENPYIENAFFINHFVNNRKNISKWQKIKEAFRTVRIAASQLKKYQYDYYLDVRYTDAVAHFILPFIDVKQAFGFSRRGLGDLLTKEFDVPGREFHHFEMYLLLLKEIGIEASFKNIEPYFSIPSGIEFDKISNKIGLLTKNYFMVFPEAGTGSNNTRQLSKEVYAEMIGRILTDTNLDVLLCGQTDLSQKIRDLIPVDLQNRVIDTSSKININEIARLTQKAQFAITLDSFPEHLSCVFCKTISIYNQTAEAFLPLANHTACVIYVNKNEYRFEFERENVEVMYLPTLNEQQIIGMIHDKALNFYKD